MTGPDAGHGDDHAAYRRTFRYWETYYAVAYAACLALLLDDAAPLTGAHLAALLLVLLVSPWYLLVGRPALLPDVVRERRSAVYVAGLVALFAAGSSLAGEVGMLAFAVVPQCFMLLPLRWAVPAVTAIDCVPLAAWVLPARAGSDALFFDTVLAGVTTVSSLVLGCWISAVVDRSRERGELIAELETSREEVARLSAAQGALAERERLSREIHDTLAQGFTSLLMLVQAVQSELDRDPSLARRHLDLAASTARENLAEARALVAGAGPSYLDHSSLPDAVRRLADRYREQTGAAASVDVSGTARALPAALEVVALRTCQEALTNARRHAGRGAEVSIALHYRGDALRIAVRDTGRGFDPDRPPGGYGLAGLRARAEEVGGTAEVRAAPGEGVTVTVELPVRATEGARSTA